MTVDISTVANSVDVQKSFTSDVSWRKYDGLRVKGSDSGAIYLVINGILRWIPNEATYNSVFSNWSNIVVSDYLVNSVPSGEPLSNGSVLVKDATHAAIYLVTLGCKMWVPNPATMEKFSFASPKIVPSVVIQFLRSGPDVG